MTLVVRENDFSDKTAHKTSKIIKKKKLPVLSFFTLSMAAKKYVTLQWIRL